MTDIIEYGMGTMIESWRPWGLFRKAKVMCSDGVVRTTVRMAVTADTFFSVPCAICVWDKDTKRTMTVSGYATIQSAQGFDTCTDDDPAVVRFVAVKYRKNWAMLPDGMWKAEASCEHSNA